MLASFIQTHPTLQAPAPEAYIRHDHTMTGRLRKDEETSLTNLSDTKYRVKSGRTAKGKDRRNAPGFSGNIPSFARKVLES